MSAMFLNGAANHIDAFGKFQSTVEMMEKSILWQLEKLQNPVQFPFIEIISYTKSYDDFRCVLARELYHEELTQEVLQTLILSSGYYNALMGKGTVETRVQITLVDPQTREVYKTFVYPAGSK